MKHLHFRNGDSIPIVGLGTWKSEPGEVYSAILEALKAGYRHLDCAFIYGNEDEIGKALQKAFEERIVKREDLFITSKLWNNSHKKEDVKPAIQKTLNDLQLDYLDLYLMHWPVAQKPDAVQPSGGDDFLSVEEVPLAETWEGMELLKKDGLAKHIGVSNFSVDNLRRVIDSAGEKPEMNQVESHPKLTQENLIDFCRKEEILVTAYSPLGSTDRASAMKKEDEPNLFELDSVRRAAENHDVSSAQVLVAWSVNRDVIVIPKSTTPAHIKSNLEAAEINLSNEEIQNISNENENYRFVDGSFWTTDGSPYTLEFIWGDNK